VVQLADLPAICLRDPAASPFQHQMVAANFRHSLGDADELERVRQIIAVKTNNRVKVFVKHR
jgi:hypothetical protein